MRKGKKKTHEEFVKEVCNLVGNEYEVLGVYVNSKTKILMNHVNCNHEWEVRPANFLTGNRCPLCTKKENGKKLRKTHEQFVKEIKNLFGSEYTIIGTYQKCDEKVKVRHEKCGKEYFTLPEYLLDGKGCYDCGIIKRTNKTRKSQEVFEEEVLTLGNREYIVLSEYAGNKKKVKIKHISCGFEWEVTPSHFLSGTRCPNCASNKKKTTEEFKQEVYDLVGNKYTVLGNYVDLRTKIKIKHEICDHVYDVKPNGFLNGTRCPNCKSSKGEMLIYNYLKYNSINFKTQFRVDDCKLKKTLPFDFAIFNKENELVYVLEYDGEQHFRSVKFGGSADRATKEFAMRKKRDQIKNQYCRDNNIPLYRIPYWKFGEIESILNKLINGEEVLVDETSFLVL